MGWHFAFILSKPYQRSHSGREATVNQNTSQATCKASSFTPRLHCLPWAMGEEGEGGTGGKKGADNEGGLGRSEDSKQA